MQTPLGMLKIQLTSWLSGQRQDILVPHFTFVQLHPGYPSDAGIFRQIASLRYEVYCLECRYLDARDYPQHVETDAYDVRSTHVGALDHEQLMTGTVRLVQADRDQAFPFEEHCRAFGTFDFPPRETCAEVSRLVVRKDYRRRPGDSLQGVSRDFMEKGNPDTIAPAAMSRHGNERRSNSPEILLGLYREMYRFSRKAGIRYWFAAMEKSLARSLARMGFPFEPIGPEVDYYGPVTPFMADLDNLAARLRTHNPFLYAWFHDQPVSVWLLLRTWIHLKLRHHRPSR